MFYNVIEIKNLSIVYKLSFFPTKVNLINLEFVNCRLRTFPLFYRVIQSKFETKRFKGLLVIVGHANKQTDRETNIERR